MGPRRWQRIATGAILTATALALPATSVLARPATLPRVSFTPSPATALSDVDDVYFNASSTSDPSCPAGIASYTFSFGDGTSSASTYAYAYHYFHVSTGSQTFPVTLTVVDNCGQSNSSTIDETVDSDAGPTALLTVTNSSASPYVVYADASASTATAPSYLYEYDFSWNDGTPDNVTYAPRASFSHPYMSPGPETVTVSVYDDGGMESQKSQTVNVPFTSPPTSPSNVTASPGDTKATVKWSPPTSGGIPSQYVITTYADSSLLTTHTFPGTNTRATVTGLTDGTTYSFTVTAVVGGADSAPSQRSNPVLPVGKPGVPTSVNAVQDDTAAVVQWKAPTTEGSTPLSYHQGISYIVTTNPAVVKPLTVNGDPAPTNVTIPGLTPGHYTFTVIATTLTASNTVLKSAPSNPSTPVTLDPQGPTLTEQPQLKLIKPSTVGSGNDPPVMVNVVWTASVGSSGSTPECGYDIRRSLNNAAWVDETPTLWPTESFDDLIPSATPPDLVRYEVGIVTSTDCASSSTWAYGAWGQSSEFAGRELADSAKSKFTYSAGWTLTTCSNCTDGEDSVTTTKGATVTLTLNSAFNFGLIFTAGPGLGSVSVTVTLADGTSVTKTMFSTSASSLTYRQLLFKTGWSMFQAATVTVRSLGTSAIDFDGAEVLYAPLARLAT